MSAPSSRRTRIALGVMVTSLVVLGSGLGLIWRDAGLSARPDVSGPVVENWTDVAGSVRQIRVETAETSFTLERYDSGWRMPSRGGYPVDDTRIAALDETLSSLSYEAAMTRNEEMFERLSLGDPADGGGGTRLTVTGEGGQVLTDLIIGETRGEDEVYIRPTGGPRAYRVRGQFPDLDDAGRWLGLDFMNLDPESIARARVVPITGPGYELARAGFSARNFDLRNPRTYTLSTTGSANGVAVSGARVRFRDVRPAADIVALPVASHAGVTFSGLAYVYAIYPEDGRYWVRLDIQAVSDDVEERANRLSGIVEGWEFEISADAFERMTRPIENFATAN